MSALEKFAAIFRHAPWLMHSDNALHMPVADMPKDHQVTWKELARLVCIEGRQQCAECDCGDPPSSCNWIKS